MANPTGSLEKCHICGRKILVERSVNGTDHTLAAIVNCWDCLPERAKAQAREMYKIDGERAISLHRLAPKGFEPGD
jgi:hypothetical protein